MDFHEFHTVFESVRRKNPSFTHEDFLDHVATKLKEGRPCEDQRDVDQSRYESEIAWLKNGRPYFKIWPNIIPLLTNIGIDVPISHLRVPFSAFVLRLPINENPLAADHDHPVRSVLVLQGQLPSGVRAIVLWVDVGENIRDGGHCDLSYFRLECHPDRTIEESLNPKSVEVPGLDLQDDLRDKLLRLAVSVCFLATGSDRVIEPDVLSKDFATYIEAHRKADSEKVRTIEARAVRRGKLGWNVGHRERIRPLTSRQGKGEQSESHAALAHQHQRRAHFRVLSTGKVTFIRQATVRPDLPPPSTAVGYELH
jgi:hypothetical protein